MTTHWQLLDVTLSLSLAFPLGDLCCGIICIKLNTPSYAFSTIWSKISIFFSYTLTLYMHKTSCITFRLFT